MGEKSEQIHFTNGLPEQKLPFVLRPYKTKSDRTKKPEKIKNSQQPPMLTIKTF